LYLGIVRNTTDQIQARSRGQRRAGVVHHHFFIKGMSHACYFLYFGQTTTFYQIQIQAIGVSSYD
jgi:hypothetical protein